ncbi:MAG: tandem-95 repeat protein [Verrucomicrobiales bacterium]
MAFEFRPGEWAHLALVLDRAAGLARLFVNGIEASYGNEARALPPGAEVAGGSALTLFRAEGAAADAFAGTLDEFGQWARALTAEEIAALANAGRAGFRALALGGLLGEPNIATNPGEISVVLNPGGSTVAQVAIDNLGSLGLAWLAEIDDPTIPDLATLLANLDGNNAAVRAAIPSAYLFTDGVAGNAIIDGGDDMYDGGNFISTDLAFDLPYSDGRVIASDDVGSNGAYFTRKYAGWWVFAADLGGIDAFDISGNLGADGGGSVDGAVLETQRGSRRYRAFIKRVWGALDPTFPAPDPSVNHMVIVEDSPGLDHTFSGDTDNDQHTVTGLAGSRRLYYLLYAGADGLYIDDDAAGEILDAFLDAGGLGDAWFAADQQGGYLAPGDGIAVNFQIDAGDLPPGADRDAIYRILSNDPAAPVVEVPVRLHVNAPPQLAYDPVIADEDTPAVAIDLFAGAEDEDADADLVFTLEGNDHPALFASVEFDPAAGQITLVPAADAFGSATLTVRAADTMGLVSEAQIAVEILPVNDSPVALGLPPVAVDEDAPPAVVSLLGAFTDVEDSTADFGFAVQSVSGAAVAGASVDAAGGLTLTFAPDAFGEAEVIVRGTDTGGLFAEFALAVSVAPVNDAPVALGIADVSVDEDAPPTFADLMAAFEDIDNADADLAFSAVASRSGLVDLTIDPASGQLGIAFLADANGSAEVTVRATDPGGLFAEATFLVEVAVNDAPVSLGIPDVARDEDAPPATVDLFAAFADVDHADADLTFTVEANSDPALFGSVLIDPAAGTLALAFARDQNGASTLTVRAADPDGLFAEATFEVRVAPVNDAGRGGHRRCCSRRGWSGGCRRFVRGVFRMSMTPTRTSPIRWSAIRCPPCSAASRLIRRPGSSPSRWRPMRTAPPRSPCPAWRGCGQLAGRDRLHDPGRAGQRGSCAGRRGSAAGSNRRSRRLAAFRRTARLFLRRRFALGRRCADLFDRVDRQSGDLCLASPRSGLGAARCRLRPPTWTAPRRSASG